MNQKSKQATDRVVERVIARMREGNLPSWTPGRKTIQSRPYNVVRKTFYRGLNSLVLSFAGYPYNAWGTFRNWESLDTSIRRGEKATLVIAWARKSKMVEVTDKEGNVTEKEKFYWVAYAHNVFNISQTTLTDEQIQELMGDTTPSNETNLTAEEISRRYLEASGVQLHNHGGTPCYRISEDAVYMPGLQSYKESDQYYSTLFHEETHSTGAASRLDRFVPGTKLGDEVYSEEELVAEMASCLLCQEVGIVNSRVFDNSVAYLASWLRTFESDPNMILRASSAAQKAVDLILGKK